MRWYSDEPRCIDALFLQPARRCRLLRNARDRGAYERYTSQRALQGGVRD